MVNATLVRAVMENIAANPDTWNQDTFVGRNECGTTYCFAGHTMVVSGLDPRSPRTQEIAEELLGLPRRQADKIFYYFPETEIEEAVGERGFLPYYRYQEFFARRFELMCKRVSDVTGVDCMDLAYRD